MTTYIALVRKDPESAFGVEFPDFPGCISSGATLDEAAAGAAEALALHIRGMVEDDEPLPEPSALEEVMRRREAKGAVAILVSAPTPRAKAVRVNVTFSEPVLARIDQAAAALGKTRAAFLAEAAEARSGRPRASGPVRLVGAAPGVGPARRRMTAEEIAETRAQQAALRELYRMGMGELDLDEMLRPHASKKAVAAVDHAMKALAHPLTLRAQRETLAAVFSLLQERLRAAKVPAKEQAAFLKKLSEELAG